MIVGHNFDTMLAKLDENELKLLELKKGPIIYSKMYKFIPKEVWTNENEQDCS